jgi:CubicO group peptidase (beta-lactamase class C family)
VPRSLLRRSLVFTVFTLGALAAGNAGAQAASRAAAIAAVDSVVAGFLKDGRAAGMSVAVLRAGDTLVLKGYGKADLELDVPTPANAVYEIGSVTKQFTAAALLLLEAEGKLSLEDDVTKHLPDYPTAGQRLPLRRLLDHSSGIKGYTELPAFRELMARKMPKDSLVAIFRQAPVDFAPGAGMIYNNSAYFLAGLVIEKVSGMSYADFVAKRFFEPLGMTASHYCDERRIVKNRAHGYDAGPDGQLLLKAYLDHTWPYAAGSLCSTAGDLGAWLHALHTGRVLSERAYRSLITPDTLTDGTRLRYAKGVALMSIAGHRAIEHGGGINGYLSESIWLPDQRAAVVVLINTAGPVGADDVGAAIVRAVFGSREQVAAKSIADLSAYSGTFQGPSRGSSLTLTFSADSGQLIMRAGREGEVSRLTYVGDDTFVRGNERVTFLRDGARVVRVRVDRVYQNTVLVKRP